MVIDQGRVVEGGTYGELLAKDGRFADLVALQRFSEDVEAGES